MAVIKRPRHHYYLMQLTYQHPYKLILFPAYDLRS